MQRFADRSHQSHEAHYRQFATGGENARHARAWLDWGTVDAWRHLRMYQTLDPLLQAEPESRWVTVGDGRFGNDAHYLLSKGISALATDISDLLLREAAALGHIREFRRENAEALSFSDREFDFVLCKESLHHFPRPMLGLYEMVRVARRGVILIEPNDRFLHEHFVKAFFRNLIEFGKRVLGRQDERHGFEVSGNYAYNITPREVEKTALGMNLPAVAFKGFNDLFFPDLDQECVVDQGPRKRALDRGLQRANFLRRLGILEYGMFTSIIFTCPPTLDCLKALAAAGFEIRSLPENPYLSR